MSTSFEMDLVNQNIISADQFLAVFKEQLRQQDRFGSLAIRNNLMTVTQVGKVLDAQAESDRNASFGDLAVSMGYLQPSDIQVLLFAQYRSRPCFRKLIAEMGILSKAEVETLYRSFNRNGARPERQARPRRPKFRNRTGTAASTMAYPDP